MKYAVNVPNFGVTGYARALADLAQEVEAAGWDGFFIWDHLALPWPAPVVDATVGLAAIALATERIRFGALMTPLPRRCPAKFARETATLDRLSGGRLVVGVGIGLDEEMNLYGAEPDARTRGAMLDEALEVVAGLWRGEPFSYQGQHFSVKELAFTPTPVQQPRIPVWTAGGWPGRVPFQRAARWDGVFPMPRNGGPDDLLSPADIGQIAELIRSQPVWEPGRPFDVVTMGYTPGDDPIRAAEIVAPYAEAGVTWWQESIHELRFDPATPPLDAFRERIRQGPPGG